MSYYYCPHCGNQNIVNNDDSFECSECRLEFDKKDFHEIEDKSNILSIEEKLGISQVLKKFSKGDIFQQLDAKDATNKVS